jgi:hypothetical protein
MCCSYGTRKYLTLFTRRIKIRRYQILNLPSRFETAISLKNNLFQDWL